jgi:hypothetical protein
MGQNRCGLLVAVPVAAVAIGKGIAVAVFLSVSVFVSVFVSVSVSVPVAVSFVPPILVIVIASDEAVIAGGWVRQGPASVHVAAAAGLDAHEDAVKRKEKREESHTRND